MGTGAGVQHLGTADESVAARAPTGIDSPLQSSCRSPTAARDAHDGRSAKNCGWKVSRNSMAVGTPVS